MSTKLEHRSAADSKPSADEHIVQTQPLHEPRAQLRSLTGLRIVAAVMIVILHSADTFSINNGHFLSKLALIQGVSLFFVLSGFILTYTYRELSGRKEICKFVLFRLARIWPVHAVTALVAVIMLTHKWAGHAYVLLPNLLLVQDWIPIERFYFSLNLVSWSVSAELFFYCCFPFLSTAVKKKSVVTLLFSFLVAATCIALSGHFPSPLVSKDIVTSFGLVYVNPVVRLFEFAVGIATANLFLRYRKGFSQLRTVSHAAIEFSVVVSVLFAVAGLRHVFPAASLDAMVPNLSTWADTSGGVFAYAALIFMLAGERGLTHRILRQPLLVWLGEISYSVYLVHWLWIKVFAYNHFTELHLPRMGAFSLYLFLVFTTAALMYTFVEKPARSFLGARIKNW